MMADELLNAQDLITAKKHDTFHSEVITGKTGGLSTGANIDYATNAVTGQVQKTLPKVIDDLDWSYVGLFADGVTFTDKTDFAVDAVGTQWIYTGSLPFSATAGTVPSEPTYQVVHVGSLQALSGMTDPSDLDKVFSRAYNSLKELSEYPIVNLFDRLVLTTKSFFDGWAALDESPSGGATYIYIASMSKSNHNGATIIAPESLLAWDGTKANLSQLFDWVGSGLGCFVLKDELTVDMCGAVARSGIDDKLSIDKAIAVRKLVKFTGGTYYTSGSHVLSKNNVRGVSRDESIVKALGTNSGVTIFTGTATDAGNPSNWGQGAEFSIRDIGIQGNWDTTSGRTLVGQYLVGVTNAQYNIATNTSLVKIVSGAYCFIEKCRFEFAYEHAVSAFRLGYSSVSSNIIASNRGTGVWVTADAAESGITSTKFDENQVTLCRGEQGGAIFGPYIYTSTISNNIFEACNYGYSLLEGADVTLMSNHCEKGYAANDDVGVQSAYIDEAIWGYLFLNESYNPQPPFPTSRGYIRFDKENGIVLGGQAGYAPVGVTFPVSQAPSPNPNCLDDYSEESWTPTGNGVSFSSATGSLIKIGRAVTATFTITMPATADGNAFRISGIPYNAASATSVGFGKTGLAENIKGVIAGTNNYVDVFSADEASFKTNSNFSGKTITGSFMLHTAQ